jgi:hypothetical protein
MALRPLAGPSADCIVNRQSLDLACDLARRVSRGALRRSAVMSRET